MEEQKKQTVWDVLHPKKAFMGGIVFGVMVSGIIALGVTLGVVVTGDGGSTTTARADAADKGDSGAAAPAAQVAEGSLDVDSFRNVRGAEDPDLYLVEYSDFECPFCARHHPTMQAAMDKFDGQVAWVYKHFPLSFHPEAVPAGIAAECAGEQGSFWEYGDELFANTDSLGGDYYVELASELGLNQGDFEKCLEDDDIAARITSEQSEGSGIGVKGTPATFLVNKDGDILSQISGAVPESQFVSAIEAELN